MVRFLVQLASRFSNFKSVSATLASLGVGSNSCGVDFGQVSDQEGSWDSIADE